MNQSLKIREKIREAGLFQWQVAQKIGVSEFTLIRWLRSELSEERVNAIYKAIETLAKKEA